jgi:putative tricarboxylic transport membrane protein
LFTKNPEVFVYPLFISGFIANTMMFFMGVYLCKYIARVLYIRKSILNTIILLLCVVGSFALNNNIFDVWVMLIMGVFGYILMKLNFPLAPMILGIILGPIAERAFVISMILSNNNPWVFFTRPVSGPITILAILAFLIPFSRVLLKKVKRS